MPKRLELSRFEIEQFDAGTSARQLSIARKLNGLPYDKGSVCAALRRAGRSPVSEIKVVLSDDEVSRYVTGELSLRAIARTRLASSLPGTDVRTIGNAMRRQGVVVRTSHGRPADNDLANVYALSNGAVGKIGISIDPTQRIRRMRATHGFTLIAAVPMQWGVAKLVERMAHARIASPCSAYEKGEMSGWSETFYWVDASHVVTPESSLDFLVSCLHDVCGKSI